eukprot:m.259925 g.259925  ORF g.259925 m.259925 type:complete len:303 (-) comp54588_c0_seq6:145-1053(-)
MRAATCGRPPCATTCTASCVVLKVWFLVCVFVFAEICTCSPVVLPRQIWLIILSSLRNLAPIHYAMCPALSDSLGLHCILGFKKPSDPVFLDLGANIGTHSVFLSAMGIRTHAFEPLPTNLAVLYCTKAANPIMQKTLTINPFGLSNADSDSGCMNVIDNNQGNAWLVAKGEACQHAGLRLRRLDDYWKQYMNEEHVFALKMDIQGYEMFAFEGAREMFTRKPPLFLFIEFSPWRYKRLGQDPRKFLEDLIGLGYSIKRSIGEISVTLENGELESLLNENEVDIELKHEARYAKFEEGKIHF